jgi:subtilisin family serine protease
VLLALYTGSIWPQYSESGPLQTPTTEISGTQGIGGVDSRQSNNGAPSIPSKTTDKPSANDRLSSQSNKRSVTVAPKQSEITKRTQIEYPYKALRTSNDPLPQPSWAMSATKMQAAWDQHTGNGAIIAVIDSGFALNHEDLASQWHTNSGETGFTKLGDRCWSGLAADKKTNNCDDDNNGYQDDWRGWDFVGVNNLPQAGETNPFGAGVAHGTQVAGLAGAAGNNGVGTATVSWNNKIMPLQALDDDGSGFTSSVTAAVYYAADNGASVINMSLGGEADDPTLAAAIDYAHSRGVVVVAAAGNCGTGSEQGCDPARPGAMAYPALNQYVIAVGATNSSNTRASFSSYGPGLDVAAPGSGTLISPMWQSGNPTSAYATTLYGTSFASPIVASYVGLIKALRPSSSVEDIIALVNATSSKPSGMGSAVYDIQYGHGIVDADAGLRVATSLNLNSTVPELLQAGDHISEHSYTKASTLSSGCKSTANSYCTIWAKNASGYDRYLPYIQTDNNGNAGWNWPGSWLNDGEWLLKSRSGNNSSTTPYLLFSK